jgi:transcriptional regulator with XRE-family HTH domain
MKNFGEYIRDLRISKEITLREFCKNAQQDPSNWSKTERGIIAPPKSKLVLDQIIKALDIKKDTEEYYTIFDLAAISFIPKGLLSDKDLLEKLPVLFRSSRGRTPNKEELERLANKIREE